MSAAYNNAFVFLSEICHLTWQSSLFPAQCNFTASAATSAIYAFLPLHIGEEVNVISTCGGEFCKKNSSMSSRWQVWFSVDLILLLIFAFLQCFYLVNKRNCAMAVIMWPWESRKRHSKLLFYNLLFNLKNGVMATLLAIPTVLASFQRAQSSHQMSPCHQCQLKRWKSLLSLQECWTNGGLPSKYVRKKASVLFRERYREREEEGEIKNRDISFIKRFLTYGSS